MRASGLMLGCSMGGFGGWFLCEDRVCTLISRLDAQHNRKTDALLRPPTVVIQSQGRKQARGKGGITADPRPSKGTSHTSYITYQPVHKPTNQSIDLNPIPPNHSDPSSSSQQPAAMPSSSPSPSPKREAKREVAGGGGGDKGGHRRHHHSHRDGDRHRHRDRDRERDRCVRVYVLMCEWVCVCWCVGGG